MESLSPRTPCLHHWQPVPSGLPFVVLAALHDYRRSTAGFTDCLIGHRNAAHGCNETGAFDKLAKGVARFKIL